MNDHATIDAFGTLIEPATLKIQRILPGPIERVWTYLTDSNLRRQWLASGTMEGPEGTAFELVWRNDELTNPPGRRPEGFSAEHSMPGRILAFDPPKRLSFTWNDSGSVTIELAPRGNTVLLTLVHDRLPEGPVKLMIGAGWHLHLDVLAARVADAAMPEPFWDAWARLRKEYERRFVV